MRVWNRKRAREIFVCFSVFIHMQKRSNNRNENDICSGKKTQPKTHIIWNIKIKCFTARKNGELYIYALRFYCSIQKIGGVVDANAFKTHFSRLHPSLNFCVLSNTNRIFLSILPMRDDNFAHSKLMCREHHLNVYRIIWKCGVYVRVQNIDRREKDIEKKRINIGNNSSFSEN